VAAFDFSPAQAAASMAEGQQASVPIQSLLMQIDADAVCLVRAQFQQTILPRVHAFLQSASRSLQGSPFPALLSGQNRAFWAGLSASGRTVGTLHCDCSATWRVVNRVGTVAFTLGSPPRTTRVLVAASPNTLFPRGVEPEVSAPSPMSTAGAGLRGIAAAKETCSAPIRINFSCQANFPANFPAPT
jgi:hypothetical protein